ncbi:MAG TPA: phosphoribosylaminoimidazole carboxylase, partial [Methanomicrobiales archaeon]|nr:phosphoribosylaminoimidazole carboxylase [Methanomicrobiales archaeon]
MQPHATLLDLLEAYRKGEISREEAAGRIEGLRIEQLEEFARLDLGRSARCGVPEVILAEGKEPERLADIVARAVSAEGRCVVTRVTPGQAELILLRCTDEGYGAEYREVPRAVIASRVPPPGRNGGIVAIL